MTNRLPRAEWEKMPNFLGACLVHALSLGGWAYVTMRYTDYPEYLVWTWKLVNWGQLSNGPYKNLKFYLSLCFLQKSPHFLWSPCPVQNNHPSVLVNTPTSPPHHIYRLHTSPCRGSTLTPRCPGWRSSRRRSTKPPERLVWSTFYQLKPFSSDTRRAAWPSCCWGSQDKNWETGI